MKKKNVSKVLVITAVLVACLSSLGADRPARAAVEHAIEVKAVSGAAEYAYDSTGWKPLTTGKVLHPGAHIRTGEDAKVLLSMEESGSLLRLGSFARLEISKSAPQVELAPALSVSALQAKATTVKKADLNVKYSFTKPQNQSFAALQ